MQACFSIVTNVLLLIYTCMMPPVFAPDFVLHYLLLFPPSLPMFLVLSLPVFLALVLYNLSECLIMNILPLSLVIALLSFYTFVLC